MAVQLIGGRGCKFRPQFVRRETEAGCKEFFHLVPAGHFVEGDFNRLRLGLGPSDFHHAGQDIFVYVHGHLHGEADDMAAMPYGKKKVWLLCHTSGEAWTVSLILQIKAPAVGYGGR